MNWKKSIHAVISLVSAVAIAQSGVETMATTDLSRKPYTGVSWTWTACSDVAVRLAVQKNGDDFPTAGWGGTLFIGDGTLGCAVPGVPYMYNELLFDVERGLMPTNGRYAVQIIATNAAGRVEEWSRGMLTVRANPAAEGMPTNWNAYADLAAKVAPYINAEGILTSPDNAGALWGAVSNRTADLIIHSTTGAVATLEADVSALQSATQTLQGAVGEMRNNTYTKDETDARIVELSPPTDLTPATNYTDEALGQFAATGTITRALSYGTPTRWVDATGCVWEVTAEKAPWTGGPSSPIVWDEETGGWLSENGLDLLTWSDGEWSFGCGTWTVSFSCMGEWDDMRLVLHRDSEVPDIVLERGLVTNLVGRVALTNDIPAVPEETDPHVPSWAKASSKPTYSWGEITGKPDVATHDDATNAAEAVVREKSLGGIWDSQLQVWWTPVMVNGGLTYQATTNVDLNAGN